MSENPCECPGANRPAGWIVVLEVDRSGLTTSIRACAMSDFDISAPLSWPQFRACCRELDRRVATGELASEEAVRMAYEVGPICNQAIPRLPHEISDVMAFYPERIPDPAFENPGCWSPSRTTHLVARASTAPRKARRGGGSAAARSAGVGGKTASCTAPRPRHTLAHVPKRTPRAAV